jgi:hypothetical protein
MTIPDTVATAKTVDDGLCVLTLLDLPVPLRVSILNYLGQTQEELMNLTLVSKQLYKDCYRPGIEWKIIPTIEISALQQEGGGSIHALLQQLCKHILDNETNRILHRYPHMKIKDVNEFGVITDHAEFKGIIIGAQMDGILSLDFSLSSTTTTRANSSLLYVFSCILPNLREINLFNIRSPGHAALMEFSNRCPYLEKVTWNNINANYSVYLDGCHMRSAKNIKEIIMDDSVFYYFSNRDILDKMSDLENQRDTFIFHYCCKVLERVSIRNAKWHPDGANVNVVPQNALIKFVRKAPTSLRWFRSDLTVENMNMLRLERPELELLN